MNPHHRHLRSERGSLLVVAMILTAIIGISIVSYLGLSRTGMTISNRALYNNGAMNLAENGLEEAMYSINKAISNPSYSWTASGWTDLGGVNARRQIPATGTYAFDQGATGIVRVFVYNYQGSGSPRAVARSTITLGGGNAAVIEKWVEVRLRRTSRFATGLVAKDSVLFKGNNATVDSWDSDPANNGSFTPFAPGIKKDNGSVGSISVSVDAVLVKNADVWGYVSTAGVDPTTGVGPTGSILGATSVYDPFTWTDPDVDPARVSTDFSASFDEVTTPAGGASIGSLTATTYGTAGAATTIVCDDIIVAGNNNVVTFQGDVTLIILATGQAIKITGNGSGIKVATNSSLKIYTAGDIDLTGQGITNVDGAPADVQLFGTKTSGTQDIKIAGGGTFSGVIYAPHADVTINGDGSMYGSVVAENITLTGNANFHYDEALADLDAGAPFRISLWKEVTSATDRAALAADLSF